ncbi:MAG: transcriptional repressor [Gemmatimonadetes bacterium]|nr:transcriptional repressor [Gemmatimonadota bacterium]MYB99166.1 transcriptional repressor [Gemmatimonadota bacterium]MYI45114.1 transcriptional repressor [Gemmatimonadota bacterium]
MPTAPQPVVRDRLREALETRGHRFTEQRGAVHRFLAGTDTHPTAEEVFRGVRGELPAISLATVYKNLETLVACGLALKLTYSDGSSRYDGRTDPHHHARCNECGRVRDVPGDLPPEVVEELQSCPSFQVTGYRLELTGVCSACA